MFVESGKPACKTFRLSQGGEGCQLFPDHWLGQDEFIAGFHIFHRIEAFFKTVKVAQLVLHRTLFFEVESSNPKVFLLDFF